MSDQLQFLLENIPHLLIGFPGQRPGGLLMSILLAIAGVGLGFGLAVPLALGQNSAFAFIRWGCRLFVDTFRGIPLILLLLIIFQIVGSGRFGFRLEPRGAAILSLTLYSAAYQAEIVRAGLNALPVTLDETARLFGYSPLQRLLLVRLPYAVRTMLPALTGQAISLFKDTSVVIIVGMSELMMSARILLGNDVTNAPYWVGVYLTVGLLYFSAAFGLSKLAEQFESNTGYAIQV
ncbi:MAG: general L-amino acid transport system permease protein [Candidatus Promineifilaceae bacterium]|jgi:general L-amino acid transport system permease protein